MNQVQVNTVRPGVPLDVCEAAIVELDDDAAAKTVGGFYTIDFYGGFGGGYGNTDSGDGGWGGAGLGDVARELGRADLPVGTNEAGFLKDGILYEFAKLVAGWVFDQMNNGPGPASQGANGYYYRNGSDIQSDIYGQYSSTWDQLGGGSGYNDGSNGP